MDDRELLHAYQEHQSEKAFTELVDRHVRLVYATAWRITKEQQAADDVVQAVFVQLAQKSWMVRDGNTLPGWLYRTTHRTALNELRKEQRRRQRETEAMNNAELESGADPTLAQLLPLLDEALRQLSSVDQNLIIQRFFENKSLRETGAVAGLSEQAAHNRITRAIEKLRKHFARAGVTVATAVVETVLTAPSSQAIPVGLAAKVTATALAGSGAALGVVDAILKFFLTMNTKTQIALAVLVIGLMVLPLLRSAPLPVAKTVALASLAAENNNTNQSAAPTPTNPVVSPPTLGANQPLSTTPVAVVSTNPTSPLMAQSGPPPKPIGGTPPLGGPAGTVSNGTAGTARNVNAAPTTAGRPLSHNVALRITGTLGLGTDHSIDITFTGVQQFYRTIPLGTHDSGPNINLITALIQANISATDDGCKVDYSIRLTRPEVPSMVVTAAKGSVILKPGESTMVTSADGNIINVNIALADAPEANPPTGSAGNPGENFMTRMQGDLSPDSPVNVTIISTLEPNAGQSNTESHNIDEVALANGQVHYEKAVTDMAVLNPDVKSQADPGTYLVRYLTSASGSVPTTNAAGQVTALKAMGNECWGQVLLKIGQTATVQSVAGGGSLQLTLTSANN